MVGALGRRAPPPRGDPIGSSHGFGLVRVGALLWGLQFAFLNPVLPLLLVTRFHASPGQVGWVLGLSNAGGLVASLLLPAYADRRQDYLRPLLGCGVLTLALAALLAFVPILPVAAVGLVTLGGPAGVGVSLMFAHLQHSGATATQVVDTRALFSLAWVGGPPAATVLMATFGDRAVLAVLATLAAGNVATAAALARRHRRATVAGLASPVAARRIPVAARRIPVAARRIPVAARRIPVAGAGLLVAGFVALQATNSTAVSIMSLFVTRRLGLGVTWAGISLGVAAALEVPALLVIGRLTLRISHLALICSGCLAEIAYYSAMAHVGGAGALLGLQVLNAWFVAVVAGVGLTLFQRVVPRPGLAAGLFTNTQRLGAIAAGPIIGLGSQGRTGYAGVYAVCAVLAGVALVVISLSWGRISGRGGAQEGAQVAGTLPRGSQE